MRSVLTVKPMFVGRLHDPVLIGQVKATRKELLKKPEPLPPDALPLSGLDRIKQIANRMIKQLKIWLTELIVPATPTERLANFFRKLRHI